jgi:formylglycine-generating enzyme required for sulfatase activity
MAAALEAIGELATRTEVGDWVERSAYEALRGRSMRLAQLDDPTTEMPTHALSTYDVDVLLEAPIAEVPPSSEPPPMIAASDTHPVTDARTLRFVRPTPNLPVLVRPPVGRVPWSAIVAVSAAAVIGIAGGRALTTSLDRRVANAEPRAVAMGVASPIAPACGFGMVEVAARAFVMEADDGLLFERPAHVVRVAPFCIDRFETTTSDYAACSDRGQCAPAPTTNAWSGMTDRDRRVFDPLCNARDPAERAKHPLNCVDWETASQACRARGARLPTEAEWELAARGTDGRQYPWGDDEPRAALLNTCDRACFMWGRKSGVDFAAMVDGDDGFATTSPVGAFPAGASPYGVEDLAGNVSEWVADYYGDFPNDTRANPTGPATGAERVVRGGAWSGSLSAWARPTFRTKDPPKNRSYAIGFRCASSR